MHKSPMQDGSALILDSLASFLWEEVETCFPFLYISMSYTPTGIDYICQTLCENMLYCTLWPHLWPNLFENLTADQSMFSVYNSKKRLLSKQGIVSRHRADSTPVMNKTQQMPSKPTRDRAANEAHIVPVQCCRNWWAFLAAGQCNNVNMYTCVFE